MSSPSFPEDFLWGSSTSAYQIEGSPGVDGAGPSNWDRFSSIPGNVLNGETGVTACDHYRRYRGDISVMEEIGLQAYRFSIAWSRILPEGVGRVNSKGLDFYNRLVDSLLDAGIKPMVTLHHWDLPQALDDRGGWLNPDMPKWFVDYAAVMFEALDDRVHSWATINEPWVIMDGGFMHGALAPGHRSHHESAMVTHHLLQANAETIRLYRAGGGRQEIGLVVNLEPKHPHSESPEDLAATARAHAYMNRQYLDPVVLGQYPRELEEIFADGWREDYFDASGLCEKMDFIGVNYYQRGVTRACSSNWPLNSETVRQPSSTYTETGWEVYSPALTDVLVWVKERYGNPPVYITENGAAFYDPPVAKDGRIDDPLRQAYLHDHILAVHKAIEMGCDIRGYCAWSLLDNLEWALGFSKRFGIVHVNYETQERTLKDSAILYSQIIQSNGRILFE